MAGEALIATLTFVGFIVTLLLAIWTYIDASSNSPHPAFLWTIVVFLAPILGIVLYVVFGRNAGSGHTSTGGLASEY